MAEGGALLLNLSSGRVSGAPGRSSLRVGCPGWFSPSRGWVLGSGMGFWGGGKGALVPGSPAGPGGAQTRVRCCEEDDDEGVAEVVL